MGAGEYDTPLLYIVCRFSSRRALKGHPNKGGGGNTIRDIHKQIGVISRFPETDSRSLLVTMFVHAFSIFFNLNVVTIRHKHYHLCYIKRRV